MNERKNEIFKSEIFKKRTWRCHVFYLNYGEVRKRRFSSKRFFVSPMKLTFFSLSSDCHSSLSCKESVISVFYSRLPQSFDQNMKQDTTPWSRVSGENKENNSLQSHLSLSLFLFKKCFRRLLKSGATEIEFKDSDFWCGKKSETESHIDMSYTERLSPAVYSFLS